MSNKANLLLGTSEESESSSSLELVVEKKEETKAEIIQNTNIYNFDLETL